MTVERIHEFWFGPRPWTAAALEERMAFWFGRADEAERAERDAAIGREFGASIERAAAGELSAWAREPRGRLCLILLLDQFPRNVHRGTARAFAYDAAALELALDGIAAGMDRALDPVERVFFYMPLQHAESLDVQERSVAAYRQLLAEAPPGLERPFAECAEFAEQHRAIIARFGRFPHRNRVLGRESTPEELEYLRDAGTFGQ